MRRVGGWAAALLVVVLSAGCTAVPPRPREVRVDGVDPCALLTPVQRAELGLDQKPVYDDTRSVLYGGGRVPSCTTGGEQPRAIFVGVNLSTTGGIELFAPGKVDAVLTAYPVRGFPAVMAMPTRFTHYCSVIVDVAPGQALDVQFDDGGRKPPIPQDQLCRGAQQAADAAMATLLTLR